MVCVCDAYVCEYAQFCMVCETRVSASVLICQWRVRYICLQVCSLVNGVCEIHMCESVLTSVWCVRCMCASVLTCVWCVRDAYV